MVMFKRKILRNKSSRRYIVPICLILLLFFIAGFIYFAISYNSINSDSRKHSEMAFRAIVALNTGKKPEEVTDEDFTKITKLRLEGIVPSDSKLNYEGFVNYLTNEYQDQTLTLRFLSNRISDLKLIEKFTNLEELNLLHLPFPENDIPKWMKLLSKLGVIDPSQRNKLDLKPLIKLKNLKSIRISNSNFKSLKPLAKIKNLKSIGLNEIPHEDIQDISKLTNLEEIDFCKTGITDLEFIRELTELKSINIIEEPITDISSLKELTDLQKLAIQISKVSDLEPLRNLINLDFVFLSDCNKISSLEPLKGLKNLKELYILNCPHITDQQKEEIQKALPDTMIYGISKEN